MPTIEWNRSWAGNLAHHMRGGLEGDFYGDQWGDPEKRADLVSVKNRFLLPFVDPAHRAIEIGSGGGRWTQYLTPFKEVLCVELNPAMFAYIIERFNAPAHFQYITSHGSDLPFVPKDYVDFAFSFGVLVHLDMPIIEGYVASVSQVLKSGGNLVLQFSNKTKPQAARNPDFSDNSPDRMSTLLKSHGYVIEDLDDETMSHSSIIRARKS